MFCQNSRRALEGDEEDIPITGEEVQQGPYPAGAYISHG